MAEVELAELEAALVALAARIDTSAGERVLDAVSARLGVSEAVEPAVEPSTAGRPATAGGPTTAGEPMSRSDDGDDGGRGDGDGRRRGDGGRGGGSVGRSVGRRRDATGRRGRLLLAAAVVLAVLAVGVGLSPRARDAVADFLGLRGVEIETDAPPTSTPSIPVGGWSAGLRPVTEDEAAAVLGRPLRRLDPERFGQPASWAVTGGPGAGGPAGLVVAYYPPSVALPAGAVPEVGALLYQFVGETEAPMLRKLVPPGGISPVDVSGRPGFWVAGAHQVGVLDRDGRFAPDTVRLAGDTLLWLDGDVTFRLETGLARADAVAVAESLR
jgi:hypothetical protein